MYIIINFIYYLLICKHTGERDFELATLLQEKEFNQSNKIEEDFDQLSNQLNESFNISQEKKHI